MTELTDEQDVLNILGRACAAAGLDSSNASVIRLGENAIISVAQGLIARIARTGQVASARKEVEVARWLREAQIPAVELAGPVDQPVVVDGHAVTFWRELPPHKHGTPVEVAKALRRLHDADPPRTFELSEIQPFVRLAERIDRATTLTSSDQDWMRDLLGELKDRWDRRPDGLPWCVVHGDAWVGNVVSTADDRVVFLDLERAAIGPPEWDLVHTAIKYRSFAWISREEYDDFCTTYGHDVSQWGGFELFRDIREFRMTCMAVQVAAQDRAAQEQAVWRLECLQGKHGERPWSGWRALP